MNNTANIGAILESRFCTCAVVRFNNYRCQEKRNSRITDNIRALNSFCTSQPLNINIDPSIRLSIVDAFNIVYPRIFLAEEEQVVVVNHYLSVIA